MQRRPFVLRAVTQCRSCCNTDPLFSWSPRAGAVQNPTRCKQFTRTAFLLTPPTVMHKHVLMSIFHRTPKLACILQNCTQTVS